MTYFAGKNAVVTGAGSGIGRALALRLNAAGCQLWISDIDEAALQGTVALLSNPSVPCNAQVIDVADRGAMARWADEVSNKTAALDLLVNNAGVALMATARETTPEDFNWLMNINFWGVIYGCQAFLPVLERGQRSHLINVSSIFGMIGVPTQSAYNAAKFAVRGYSEALRQELDLAGSPVRVCCVQPGGVDTNIARHARNTDPGASADTQQALFAPHARCSPDKAAALILRAAERGQRRLLIGTDARLVDWIVRLFPSSYPRIFSRFMGTLLEARQ